MKLRNTCSFTASLLPIFNLKLWKHILATLHFLEHWPNFDFAQLISYINGFQRAEKHAGWAFLILVNFQFGKVFVCCLLLVVLLFIQTDRFINKCKELLLFFMKPMGHPSSVSMPCGIFQVEYVFFQSLSHSMATQLVVK